MMSLKGRISVIQGEQATLVLSDGQTLSVPLTAIEGIPSVDREVSLIVASPGAEDAGRQALAREILNTLLKP